MGQCEFCEGQGHILENGAWVRCKCITEQACVQQLGIFYTPQRPKKTPLEQLVNENAILEGSLDSLRPHVGRAMLSLQEDGKRVTAFDCYRLAERYIDSLNSESGGESHIVQTEGWDLVIMLIGFGEPRNKMLPELIMQLLGRRDVLRLPTWVILGPCVEIASVGMKYSSEVASRLADFKKVKMK